MGERILLSAPDVRTLEREYLLDALDSNWIAPAGPHLDEFEVELAQATGRAHAVAVSSGTAALHLALLEAGVGHGDTVLCSSLTFIGSANPIVYCGASPVFVDSEPDTWNMDPGLLELTLQRMANEDRLPKAAVVVDLYGVCARYDRIAPLLEKYDVPLIEDAAEALGASINGVPGGSFGRSAILSFNGNKIITSSGGGAVLTDSQEAADRFRYLATQAREQTLHYEHTEIGFNYRMSNLCAAVGRAQLATLSDRISRRREIEDCYRRALEPTGLVQFLDPGIEWQRNHWLTCASFTSAKGAEQRNFLIEGLAAENIESRPVWKPMHLQPVFSNAEVTVNGVAQVLFEKGICLPSGSGMSDSDLDRVIEAASRQLSELG